MQYQCLVQMTTYTIHKQYKHLLFWYILKLFYLVLSNFLPSNFTFILPLELWRNTKAKLLSDV